MRLAIEARHGDWSAAAGVTLGVVFAARGDVAAAEETYRAVITGGHADRAPQAWFNLGTLKQQSGAYDEAVAAYRQALASRHREMAPKAAVNLGFVLFNGLHDLAGAEQAFQDAIAFGHPQQTAIATQNLEAMRQLATRTQRHGAPVDDDVNVAVGRGSGGLKWRFWRRRDE